MRDIELPKEKQFEMGNMVSGVIQTIFFMFLVLLGGVFWFSKNSMNNSLPITQDKGDVLSENTSSINPYMNINRASVETVDELTLELEAEVGNFGLIDNTTHSFIEGKTSDNSVVEIEIAGQKLREDTLPDGTFAFKLPENLGQFEFVRLLTLDQKLEIENYKTLVLVLRQFLSRTYFLHPTQTEVFSLDFGDDVEVSYVEPNIVNIAGCKAEFYPELHERDYDPDRDPNIVILPNAVESLIFGKNNKFVAFDVTSEIATKSDEDCQDEFYSFGPSLVWHTEQINDLTLSRFKNPISRPN